MTVQVLLLPSPVYAVAVLFEGTSSKEMKMMTTMMKWREVESEGELAS